MSIVSQQSQFARCPLIDLDSVPHNRLLTKLKAYGISRCLHDWIQNFLSGRKQRVVLNGSYSSWSIQFLLGSLKGQFLDRCSFYYMLMIFHPLWIVQSYYLLMMPKSINQLDVKLTTCNSNCERYITTLYSYI